MNVYNIDAGEMTLNLLIAYDHILTKNSMKEPCVAAVKDRCSLCIVKHFAKVLGKINPQASVRY